MIIGSHYDLIGSHTLKAKGSHSDNLLVPMIKRVVRMMTIQVIIEICDYLGHHLRTQSLPIS